MGKSTQGIIFALLMAATIVLVDVAFFKHHTGTRFLINVGLVCVGAAIFLRFFKH